MSTTERTIAITQVLCLYGHILDGRRWDLLGSVFAQDGVFDMSEESATDVGGMVLNGLPAIVESFSTIRHALAHHVSNVYVYEADGEMRSICKLFMPDPKGRLHTGDYADRFVWTAQGWRIRHRRARERRYWDPDMQPWTFLDTDLGHAYE